MRATLFFFAVCSTAFAQLTPVKPGVYAAPDDTAKPGAHTFFSGSGHDLEFVEVTQTQWPPGAKQTFVVPTNEEQIIFITAGTLTLSLRDSTHSLVKGSLAMVLPTETYALANRSSETVACHVMRYRSKLPADFARGAKAGGSFVRDWNKLTFKPHERGGVRSYFDRATAMTKRFEVHVTSLNEGYPSHAPHTHPAEEIILVLEGEAEMLIGEENYKAKTGDALYVTTHMLHGLKNVGKGTCSYYAIQWY